MKPRRVEVATSGKVHLGHVDVLDKHRVSLQCCGYKVVEGRATEQPVNCKVCRHVLDSGTHPPKFETDQVADDIMASRLENGWY